MFNKKIISIFLFIFPLSSWAVGGIGFILPNLHSLHIGERGGVLGGAVVARVDDASSAYYNPAGLTLLPKDSFSASGSTYSMNDLKITDSISESSLTSIASYVASVWKINNLYFAFSVPTPIYSATNLQSEINDSSLDLKLSESYSSSFNVIAPGFSVAKEIAPDLRMGLSLRYYIFSLKSNVNQSLDFLSTPPSTGSVQALESDIVNADSNSLRLEYGLQKDITKNIRFGLMLKSPTIKVSSKGTLKVNFMTRSIDGSSQSMFFNEKKLDSTLQFPAEIHCGIALVKQNWDLELDLKYNHLIKNKSITSKILEGEKIERDSTGTITSASKEVLEAPTYNFKNTLNLSISSSIRMGDSYLFSAAFFTDRSPSKRINIENDLFSSVDLNGASLGLTRFTKVVSTTLGFFTSKGKTSYLKENIKGDIVPENVTIKTLGITLSGSVYY